MSLKKRTNNHCSSIGKSLFFPYLSFYHSHSFLHFIIFLFQPRNFLYRYRIKRNHHSESTLTICRRALPPASFNGSNFVLAAGRVYVHNTLFYSIVVCPPPCGATFEAVADPNPEEANCFSSNRAISSINSLRNKSQIRKIDFSSSSYWFSSSETSALNFRCHFSACRKTWRSRRTFVCVVWISSDSTSPLTTAQRPNNMSRSFSAVKRLLRQSRRDENA